MTNNIRIIRPFHLLAAVPAAVGAALGAWAYFGTQTGVDGTAGALLALLGAVAVTLGAVLVGLAPLRRRPRIALQALLILGALLTALAAWMLMQMVFAVAMLVSLIFLSLALVLRRDPRVA